MAQVIDEINQLLPTHLKKLDDQATEVDLWAAIFSLYDNYVVGPHPHETWKDAALDEKLKRIAAERNS